MSETLSVESTSSPVYTVKLLMGQASLSSRGEVSPLGEGGGSLPHLLYIPTCRLQDKAAAVPRAQGHHPTQSWDTSQPPWEPEVTDFAELFSLGGEGREGSSDEGE